jgi:hypothetical protein
MEGFTGGGNSVAMPWLKPCQKEWVLRNDLNRSQLISFFFVIPGVETGLVSHGRPFGRKAVSPFSSEQAAV